MEERDSRIDVIRLLALACLVILHYLYGCDLYSLQIMGVKGFAFCVLRAIGTCCIPLFLLISGYLLVGRQYKKGYFWKLSKVMIIYLIASVISSLVSVLFQNYFSFDEETVSIGGFILKYLNFHGCPYAWYIELYIGLFLLCPFINLLWDNLDESGKKILLLVMLLSTAAPSLINIYRVNDISWWIRPSENSFYTQIIPQYWVGLWSFTYYLIGARLKENGPIFSKKCICLLLPIAVALYGLFNYWRSVGGVYLWGTWQDWGAWTNVITSYLVFSLCLYMKPIRNRIGKRVIGKLADSVLAAYLLSWIPERVIYGIILNNPVRCDHRMRYYPATIVVYLASLILGAFAMLVYHGCKIVSAKVFCK